MDWMNGKGSRGRVAINLNGERGSYFRSKGLRGDPLSPMLFNLVGEGLAEILRTTEEKMIARGLIPELIDGGLTHLRYADDTILFLHYTEEEIKIFKFLLFCSEEMSRIIINYNKSEVFIVGVPISDRRLSKEHMSRVVEKVEKRLETWKCNHLSYGGKSILINSSLTSIPMHMMGLYWLHDGIHKSWIRLGGDSFGKGWKKRGSTI
ncbi:hypothetical protein U9M48_012776 [Paspalum notatum var. saurae]|uniref:Reverse transcriptase domain-containing protein n=1 Tax=Paspalum notatum var. saurae TaxID=547442 RepID=A0AAQ3SY75_PASNO